jgi:hypothetical protein
MSARQFSETFPTNFTSIPWDLCVPQPFRTWSDNNIWLRVQIVKLLIMKFAPACFHFHSLHSKDWKTALGTLLSDTLKLFKLPRFSRRGRNRKYGITFTWKARIKLKHSVVSKPKTLQYDLSDYVPPSGSNLPTTGNTTLQLYGVHSEAGILRLRVSTHL